MKKDGFKNFFKKHKVKLAVVDVLTGGAITGVATATAVTTAVAPALVTPMIVPPATN